MKKVILLILCACALPAMAQHDGKPREKKHRDITELVSDLSASQKRKIETISKESKERVGALRARKKEVCDSIAMFMERDGDQSRQLYPLFDREAALQVSINREMYQDKLKLDAVLTPEQRAELRSTMDRDKKKRR